jgi:tRNA-specific 2-thiouridylase
VLGTHQGLHRFTVGQRSRLGIATGERMYVTRLDKEKNVVEVAPRPGTMKSECILADVHWIAGQAPGGELHCEVRPRYRSKGATATVHLNGEGGAAAVDFDEPQFALTPGQAAVFYQNGEVLGGGWIDQVP